MNGADALALARLRRVVRGVPRARACGKVVGVRGPLVLARMPQASIGQICYLAAGGGRRIPARVAAFQEDLISLAPLDHLHGLAPGAEVTAGEAELGLSLSEQLGGSVLDCMGKRLAGPAPDAPGGIHAVLERPPPDPLRRAPINAPLVTGIRCIDGLCPIGYGQRVGLFAPAGIGKSTLLGMIARGAAADINVIALVAERGREVNDFIQESLGEEGRRKSVVVVATSDESPARRQLAAYTATAVAEHFRDRGGRVLLLMDSLTRCARAIRDVGLAAGELPVRQGYTSSVYSELPRLLERAGPAEQGSITAIYTVLTANEGDLDPLSEEIKSLLDGHIMLDASLAAAGLHPAIDLTQSVSRLLPKLLSAAEQREASTVRRMLARLKKDKDIVLFGGAPDGELAAALRLEPELRRFLAQDRGCASSWSDTRLGIKALADAANESC